MSGRAGFDGVERSEQKNIARSEGVLEAGDTSNEDAVADAKWGKVREEKRGGGKCAHDMAVGIVLLIVPKGAVDVERDCDFCGGVGDAESIMPRGLIYGDDGADARDL